MKKVMFLLIAVVVGTQSFGQLGFGIKGAVTMSNFTTDLNEINEAAKVGYQIGAFVRIGKKLHLQPEAYFTAKTGELSFTSAGVDPNNPIKTVEVKQGITFNTVDVPVLVGYTIFDPKVLKVRLQAGPVASFVTNKKYDLTLDGVESGDDQTVFDEDDFNNINWGLQFGAGVDVLFLTIDLRYELGLNDVYKNSNTTAGIDTMFKNNVFFLSVGWKIL